MSFSARPSEFNKTEKFHSHYGRREGGGGTVKLSSELFICLIFQLVHSTARGSKSACALGGFKRTPHEILTGRLVHALFHRMLFLMDPLAVALEVNLRGRGGFAVQVDGFVLDDVRLFWLHQEVWEGLGRIGGEGLRELAQTKIVVIYKREGNRTQGVSYRRRSAHQRERFMETCLNVSLITRHPLGNKQAGHDHATTLRHNENQVPTIHTSIMRISTNGSIYNDSRTFLE